MNIKVRFKKALFAFFKKEILECLTLDTKKIERTEIISHELKFTEIKDEIFFDNGCLEEPSSVTYQKSLLRIKKKIFDEAMKYIVIDERHIMDETIYPHRSVKISLFVGHKNVI